MHTILRAVAAFLVSVVPAFAAEEAKPPTPAVAEPAKAPAADANPAAALKTYAATDLGTLKSVKGQKIILEGKVLKLGGNKAETIRYLNFSPDYHTSASLVFFANSGGGKFTKEKLSEYVGKKVQAIGVLSEYNSALQIKIESLEQIKIVEEAAPTAPAK